MPGVWVLTQLALYREAFLPRWFINWEITVSHLIKPPIREFIFLSWYYSLTTGVMEKEELLLQRSKNNPGKKKNIFSGRTPELIFLFVHLLVSPQHAWIKLAMEKQLTLCPDVRRDIQGSGQPFFFRQECLNVTQD